MKKIQMVFSAVLLSCLFMATAQAQTNTPGGGGKNDTKTTSSSTSPTINPTQPPASGKYAAEIEALEKACQICTELDTNPSLSKKQPYSNVLTAVGGQANLCPRACDLHKWLQTPSGNLSDADASFVAKVRAALGI
ncbi:MAG: hypothetical protein ACK4Q5_08615 [Saprospiraceae bacterium]